MENTLIGKWAVVRSNMAGVFSGKVESFDVASRCVVLKDAIRCWKWNSDFTLSELAVKGVGDVDRCCFATKVETDVIFDVCELIESNAAARKTIEDIKSYVA